MRPGRHAKSPSKDRCDARESKRDVRRVDHAEALPVPATTGPGSPCACRCNRLPATPGRPSGLESSQCLQAVHDPNKNLDVNIAIENDTPPVRAYDLHAAPPSRGSADI